MSAGFEPPRTYMGLLDDVISRHTQRFSGRAFFNRMIAKNLFFGGGLYINDGYLVNHPAARQYLATTSSLLRVMLRYGFVRILTRARDEKELTEMPQAMAAQGSSSFSRLVASPEWKTFRSHWQSVAEAAFQTGHVRAWPNFKMHYGFTKLMQRALSAKPRDTGIRLPEAVLLRITQEFYASRPLDSGPRGKLEDAAVKVLNDTDLTHAARVAGKRSLMNVATQAYHYNFGLCMRYETDEGQPGEKTAGARKVVDVCVDTTLGPAFDELLVTDPVDLHDLEVPLFGLPSAYRFENGEVFGPLVQDDSKAYRAKIDLVTVLRDAILQRKSATPRERKQAIKAAMREFIKALRAELNFQIDEKEYFDEKVPKHVLFATGTDRSRAAVGSPHSCLTHVVATDRNCKNSLEFLVRRGILGPKAPITLREITPEVMSLMFDLAKAKDFIKDLPALD